MLSLFLSHLESVKPIKSFEGLWDGSYVLNGSEHSFTASISAVASNQASGIVLNIDSRETLSTIEENYICTVNLLADNISQCYKLQILFSNSFTTNTFDDLKSSIRYLKICHQSTKVYPYQAELDSKSFSLHLFRNYTDLTIKAFHTHTFGMSVKTLIVRIIVPIFIGIVIGSVGLYFLFSLQKPTKRVKIHTD